MNWNSVIVKPTAEEMLKVVEQHPGITMAGIHDLGYRLVFASLQLLLAEETVFLQNECYYPNH